MSNLPSVPPPPVGLEGSPLTLWLVGHGPTPQTYCVTDRKPDSGLWSFRGMTLVERAALRALCEEAIRMIDRSAEPEETP